MAGERNTISGTVTDLDGQPLAKATVIIENTKTHRQITIQTDAEGKFFVRNLKGKDYSVTLLPEISTNGATLHLDGIQGSPSSSTNTQRSVKRGRAVKNGLTAR